MDETNAYYAEQVLGNKYTLENLLEAEPTLKDKILSFFKGASTDYADVPKLSSAAKKYYKTYKKLFDEFSARNYESNAISTEKSNYFSNDVSGRDYAAQDQAKFAEYNKPIRLDDIGTIQNIAAQKKKHKESLSINAFTKEDIETTQKWAHKYYQELGAKSPFFRAWYGDWRAHDNRTKITVVKVPPVASETQRSLEGVTVNDTKNNNHVWRVVISGQGERNTRGHAGEKKKSVAGLTNIKGLLSNAILLDSEVHEHHNNNASNDFIVFDHKLYSLGVDDNGEIALYKLTVEEYYQDWKHPDSKRFHNLRYVEKVAQIPIKKVAEKLEGRQDSNEPRAVSFDENLATEYSIADLYEFVKRYDKDFTPAREISPLLLNEDRTPKVFYHGTRENFTTFELQDKPKFGRALGDGFYFTSSYDKAFKFANGLFSKGQDRGGIIMPMYLQMENPYIIQPDAYRRNWIKEYNAGNYDGIIDLKNDTYYVEGQTQIKSAENNIGTFSKYEGDINYALDIDSDDGNISSTEVMS